MSDYVIVGGNLYHADELYHHGVKGMRWGVHKARTPTGQSNKRKPKQPNAVASAAKKAVTKEGAKKVGRIVGGGVGSAAVGLAVDVRRERAKNNPHAVSTATRKAVTKHGAKKVAGTLARVGATVIFRQGVGILVPRRIRRKAAKAVGRVVGIGVGVGVAVARERKSKNTSDETTKPNKDPNRK